MLDNILKDVIFSFLGFVLVPGIKKPQYTNLYGIGACNKCYYSCSRALNVAILALLIEYRYLDDIVISSGNKNELAANTSILYIYIYILDIMSGRLSRNEAGVRALHAQMLE